MKGLGFRVPRPYPRRVVVCEVIIRFRAKFRVCRV